MTNEEKSREIVDYFFAYCEETDWTWKDVTEVSQNACKKAMKWKEEQVIEKSIQWLKKHVKEYADVNDYDKVDFELYGLLEDFEIAMKEEDQ